MGRTKLSDKRLLEIKRANIGRIIIFCEGKTEKYYFDHFAEIINKNKYTDIEVVVEAAGGNAQTVLNFANKYMQVDENIRKYSAHGKYLVFDCDDPPNIQDVVIAASEYDLLISNYLFETWLLMHLEEVEQKLSKRETYKRLSEHLCKKYKKGQKGKTREIIQTGDIGRAIDNSRMLEDGYKRDGKTILTNVKDMNPYTNVYILIEQFMLEM